MWQRYGSLAFMSSLESDIVSPGRPEIREVSAGVYAYIQPDGTHAPVRAVVNTHHHGDHTFGNCLFPGAAVIGHERTAYNGGAPLTCLA